MSETLFLDLALPCDLSIIAQSKSLPEHSLSHFVSRSWLLSRYKTTSGCEATAQCQDFYHQHWAMLLRRSEP